MARNRTRTLTEVELEFMKIVWQMGEVSTDDVLEALAREGRHLSDGTVRKMLSILVRKGYLERRREGKAFLHRAKVREDLATRNMLMDLLKRAFGGSAALMIAALMESRAIHPEDIEEIKRLIALREEEVPK